MRYNKTKYEIKQIQIVNFPTTRLQSPPNTPSPGNQEPFKPRLRGLQGSLAHLPSSCRSQEGSSRWAQEVGRKQTWRCRAPAGHLKWLKQFLEVPHGLLQHTKTNISQEKQHNGLEGLVGVQSESWHQSNSDQVKVSGFPSLMWEFLCPWDCCGISQSTYMKAGKDSVHGREN